MVFSCGAGYLLIGLITMYLLRQSGCSWCYRLVAGSTCRIKGQEQTGTGADNAVIAIRQG